MIDIDLESERLVYKRVSLEHLSSDYLGWLNNPQVNVYLESRGNYTMEMLKAYIEQQYANAIYFWGIHLKDSNKHIGNIKIDPINRESNSGEYGILMGDVPNWGKGYGKEASIRIIDYCFNELKLSKVTLGVVEDNVAAVKLYEKMGFVTDEIKANVGNYNGKICNALRMSLDVKSFK